MKTGRRRRKETPPPAEPAAADLQAGGGSRPAPAPAAQKSRRRPSIVEIALIIVVVVIAIIAIVMLSRACSGPKADVYLPAEADGSWATTVQVLAPQIADGEGWRSACEEDGRCTVLVQTCETRERRDKFTEREIENYDDYAYSIYFEELTEDMYEASGDDFSVTDLNPDEDRWEGERHIVSEEWLDRETCEYTTFSIWITDPDDTSQEVEVILSECEVWDHVIVTEKVYEREEFCQTETVQGLTVVNTLTDRGAGRGVEFPSAVTPQGGELQTEFAGTVIFRADGTEHTVSVTDPDSYVRYLTVQQYLGLDEDGNVVQVTSRLPEG